MRVRSAVHAAHAALAAAALLAVAGPAAAAPAPRVTEPFREEHAEIQVHLKHLHDMTGGLRAAPAEDARGTMKFVVKFLNEHIRAHAEWEERVLYPVVDRMARSGRDVFTATMRHEHRIIGRWIDELAAEAAKEAPGVEPFARRADNLLGLIAAHFEEEEEVLLPLIDRGMSPEQFRREVLDHRMAH